MHLSHGKRYLARLPAILLLIIALTVPFFVISDSNGQEIQHFAEIPEGSQIVLVLMPEGDAREGQKAFLQLACNSCHHVVNDRAIPVPDEKSGPDLGIRKVSVFSGYEATSIVSPSHIVRIQDPTNQKVATMPDLTASMTVKQLADLLAYLRSLHAKD